MNTRVVNSTKVIGEIGWVEVSWHGGKARQNLNTTKIGINTRNSERLSQNDPNLMPNGSIGGLAHPTVDDCPLNGKMHTKMQLSKCN